MIQIDKTQTLSSSQEMKCVPTTASAKDLLIELAHRTQGLMHQDSRVGFPHFRPEAESESFGWLFPAQQILLDYVLREETRIIVQLGAYLGKTTLFIAEQAPRAVIFVVDPWSNELLKAEPSLNKNIENIDMFDRVPFYSTFLCNTWSIAARPRQGDRLRGVVPLRMAFDEGIKLLQELQIQPDVLYWEGLPHEDELYQTLRQVHRAFPGTVIVGDGYTHSEVQRGLHRAAEDIFRRQPYVELKKCWSFAKLSTERLDGLRAKYQATDNRAERSVLAGTASKASFKDLLSGLRQKTDEKRNDEAAERAKKRREEEEEIERARREEEEERELENRQDVRKPRGPANGRAGPRGRGRGEGRGRRRAMARQGARGMFGDRARLEIQLGTTGAGGRKRGRSNSLPSGESGDEHHMRFRRRLNSSDEGGNGGEPSTASLAERSVKTTAEDEDDRGWGQ